MSYCTDHHLPIVYQVLDAAYDIYNKGYNPKFVCEKKSKKPSEMTVNELCAAISIESSKLVKRGINPRFCCIDRQHQDYVEDVLAGKTSRKTGRRYIRKDGEGERHYVRSAGKV